MHYLLQKLPYEIALLGVVDIKTIKCLEAHINCPKQCDLKECLTS